jgi:hypothetical protein
MIFDELSEFSKEFKWLLKKYKSLLDDLDEFKKVLSVVPRGNSKHFNVITKTDQYVILKARFFCRYLKGSSFRIIYSFDCQNNKIDFIELYLKSEKENEDHDRIKKYLKK